MLCEDSMPVASHRALNSKCESCKNPTQNCGKKQFNNFGILNQSQVLDLLFFLLFPKDPKGILAIVT